MEGMKIDRMFFEKFEERVKEDEFIKTNVQVGNWDRVAEYVSTHILDKPEEFFTLDKLRQAAGVDRRLSLREIIEKAYGFIQQFKSRDDLLEEEFEKFISDTKPDKPDIILPLKYFFKAYITDNQVRDIIENKRLTELNTNSTFSMQDFKAVPALWRTRDPRIHQRLRSAQSIHGLAQGKNKCLDSETKRRIDTARDILVGKVPDPKSQVEQITIALIYKFMDDMDAEAEELGGKRSFFVGEYEKFSWAKSVESCTGWLRNAQFIYRSR